MSELELKLALPPDQLEPLAAHPALRRRRAGPMVVVLMRARYCDTADRQLGALRLSLRLRQEGAD
ncbi:MAG: CYTH domain-containing protein [Ramlibacter sp.]|jgi:inorganic triphosphatase YgiF